MPTPEQQQNCQVIDPKETYKIQTGEVIHKNDWTIDALKHDIHELTAKNGLGCESISGMKKWRCL